MSAEDLISFNKKNKQTVTVQTKEGLLINNVNIKSDDTCVLELHINKDDAENLGVETGDEVEIC